MNLSTVGSFVLFFFLGHVAFGQVDETLLREKLTASTVLIANELPNGDFFMGTGWVLSGSERQIVTAYHVVQDAAAISVILPAKDANGWIVEQARVAQLPRLKAKIVRRSLEADLVLLHVPEMPTRMPELALAKEFPDSNSKAFLVGHPSTTLYQFLSGSVEGRGFFAETIHNRGVDLPIRADAIAVNISGIAGGASGAALVDSFGKVIGVLSAGSRDSGLGRAVSLIEIQRLLGDGSVIKTGSPRSIIGRWVCTQAGQGTEFAFEFWPDHKFELMMPQQLIMGTYRLGQSKVYLTAKRKTDSCTIEWLDDNQFVITKDSLVIRCKRYDGGWK